MCMRAHTEEMARMHAGNEGLTVRGTDGITESLSPGCEKGACLRDAGSVFE